MSHDRVIIVEVMGRNAGWYFFFKTKKKKEKKSFLY